MNNKAEKGKWHSLVLYVLLGIVLLPCFVVMNIKDAIARRKEQRTYRKKQHGLHVQLMPFTEPAATVPNEEFISRIHEFICIQYQSFNGLSGRCRVYQVIVDNAPRKKEQILSFLKEHPIENLLSGNLCSREGQDLDEWELRFVFADQRLNRRIRGYGITEITEPYLRLFSLLRSNEDDD